MKVENCLKIKAGSGFRRKEGRLAGLTGKNRRDGGI